MATNGEEDRTIQLDVVKNKETILIVNAEQRNDIFKKIGYSLDTNGYLIDKKSGTKIQAEDGLEINVNTDKKITLVTGTHTFVRNLAGYSQILANKNALKIEAKK